MKTTKKFRNEIQDEIKENKEESKDIEKDRSKLVVEEGSIEDRKTTDENIDEIKLMKKIK